MKVNIEHNILFEEEILQFLKDLRHLKLPCTSLRVNSLKCFPEDVRLPLLSEFETMALKKAIQLKEENIKDLVVEFNCVPESEFHLYNPTDDEDLNVHRQKLDSKFNWLSYLSRTRFSSWPDKSFMPKNSKSKKIKSKECKSARNRKKKEKKRRKKLENRVALAKEENLVFNLVYLMKHWLF